MKSKAWIFVHRSTPGLRGTNASSSIPAWVAHCAKDADVYIAGNEPHGNKRKGFVGFADQLTESFYDRKFLALSHPEKSAFFRCLEVCSHVRNVRADLLVVYSHPKAWIYAVLKIFGVVPWRCKLVLDIRSHITATGGFLKRANQLLNVLTRPIWTAVYSSSARNYRSYFFGFLGGLSHPIGLPAVFFRENKQRRQDGGPGLRVCYSGTLAKSRGLPRMLYVFLTACRSLDFEVSLEIFGDGSGRAELEQMVKQMEVEIKVTFHGEMPLAAIPESLSNCDVGLNFLSKAYTGAPSLKRLEYAARSLFIVENMNKWALENPEGFDSQAVKWEPIQVAKALEVCMHLKQSGHSEILEHNRTVASKYEYEQIAARLAEEYSRV